MPRVLQLGSFLEAGCSNQINGIDAVSPNTELNPINSEEMQPAEINEGDEDQEDEARISKGIRAPETPTQEEVAEHNRTHLPYRSWCKACVFGQGKNPSHASREKNISGIRSISWDYMYLKEKRKEGEKRSAIVEGDGMPILEWGHAPARYAEPIGRRGPWNYWARSPSGDAE